MLLTKSMVSYAAAILDALNNNKAELGHLKTHKFWRMTVLILAS
jgi:hypothetical protein